MVFPLINDPKPTTLTTYGGLELSKVQQYFSGFDIGAADDTNKPTINTETRYKSEKLQLFGSGGGANQKLIFKTPAIADQKKVSFPVALSNSQDNEFTFNEVPQILKFKAIDAGYNALTNIDNVNIKEDAAISWEKIDKTGSQLGDLDNIDLTGRLNNSSLRWDAIQAKWVMFIPSTGLDVLFSNLTDVLLNTPVAGQTIQFNGTSWVNVNSPQISSISKGKYTVSGDGIETVFSWAHTVEEATPNIAIVDPASTDAIGPFVRSVDDTNITITYQNPPPAGDNNLSWYWLVSDPFGNADNGIDVSKIVEYNIPNTFSAGNDQVFPAGNFKISKSGFKATLDSEVLTSDVTYQFPATSQSIVGRTTNDSLLNKILITPRIDSLENSGGTVTLPIGPTTLLGNDEAGTITEKIINGPDNTITNLLNDNLSNSANIDWSKINKVGSSLSNFADVIISSPVTNQLLQWNGTAWINSTISAVGETNTMSNVGTAGFGLYKQKTDVNFEMKNINVGSNKLSIADDTAHNEIDIDLVPANILLSTLGGAATWSQVSKTGSSLSEIGGTLASAQIAANAVTTVKIADANVLLAKLATDSVDASKIVDGSITNTEINAAAAIAWSKLNKATSSIDDLADVTITTPTNTQILAYNGTAWINQTPSTSSSGGVSPVTNPKFGMVIPGGNTGTNIGSGMCVGWQTDALTSGNVSLDSDADGEYISLNTTGTSQTNAEINSTGNKIFRGDLNPKIWTKIKIPNIANNRWYAGTTDVIALAENTYNFINSHSGFGIRYDTTQDTTIQLVTNNGAGTQTVKDTGITPVNNTVYNIYLEYNLSLSQVKLIINGTTVTQTTAIPASSTKMGWLQRMQNSSGSIRNMFVYYIYCEQSK